MKLWVFIKKRKEETETFPMSSPTECESTAPATSIPLAFVTAITAALPISFAAPFIMTCFNKDNESLVLNKTMRLVAGGCWVTLILL